MEQIGSYRERSNIPTEHWPSSQQAKIITSTEFGKANFFYFIKMNAIFEIWRFFQPRNDTPFPVREHAGHTTKISLEHILSSDTRDRPILPSTGTLCRLSTEMAGPLGDSALMKYIFDYQVEKRVSCLNPKNVFNRQQNNFPSSDSFSALPFA